MNKRACVAIQQCKTYDIDEVYEILQEICTQSHMPEVSGKIVLLKPNILSDAPYEKGITTRGEVVGAMIRLLYSNGAKQVLVGDSPGLHTHRFTPTQSGIAQVIAQEGASWCDFTERVTQHVIPWTHGLSLPLPTLLEEVDLIFSLSKMKTHQLLYLTGSVKNLFGMVPGLHKSACHMKFPTREAFSHLLCGLYAVIKPSFGVVDAIISMEGPGPAAGTVRHTGYLMASSDLSALDVSQSIIMGYDPLSIVLTHTMRSHHLTHWHAIEDIFYPALDPNDLIIENYKRIPIQKRTSLIGTMLSQLCRKYIRNRAIQREKKPLFNHNTCILCKKCIQICPKHVLHIDTEGKIVADYQSCIRCYCCHEVCPVNAIEIEGE